MDGGNDESRSDETEGINTSDGTYRVPQNGGMTTYAPQHSSLTNGAAQIQSPSQVLNQEGRQDPSKNQSQDGVPSTAVALSIGDVSVGIAAGIGSSTAVEDNGSQVSTGTSAASGGTVVIPQEYLAVASGAGTPHYVTTEQSHNDEGGLGVEEMDHDEKERDDLSEILREQDRFLPIANVARIMKKSIPKTGKIAKDAKECVQECVSEFISFITSEASERCHQEKRKTINGEDILFAMTTLGFEQYVEPLKVYLQKYRESMKTGEKVAMGSVTGEAPEMDEETQGVPHYTSAPIHPSMIPQEQTSPAIYGGPYQAQLQQQSLHFQTM